MYPVEYIPDADKVYYRIHKTYIKNGELIPGAFREQGESMSVDWEKYATPQVTIMRALRCPENNGVVSFIVGPLRGIPLIVTHAPVGENIAHTDVTCENSRIEENPRIRLLLLQMITWELPI